MPLIFSRTRSLALPTIGSNVSLSFSLVTINTSGDARNLEISVGVLVDKLLGRQVEVGDQEVGDQEVGDRALSTASTPAA